MAGDLVLYESVDRIATITINRPQSYNSVTQHSVEELTDAFRDASLACTACHQASGHGFIEISPTLNHAVPNLEPASAPSP